MIQEANMKDSRSKKDSEPLPRHSASSVLNRLPFNWRELETRQVTGAASSSFWRPPDAQHTAEIRNPWILHDTTVQSRLSSAWQQIHACSQCRSTHSDALVFVQCNIDVWLHEAWCYCASCPSIILVDLHKRKSLHVSAKIEHTARYSHHGSL